VSAIVAGDEHVGEGICHPGLADRAGQRCFDALAGILLLRHAAHGAHAVPDGAGTESPALLFVEPDEVGRTVLGLPRLAWHGEAQCQDAVR
jgi:hypothetical protein